MNLADLPHDHPLRNTKLLGFRYTMPGIMVKVTEVTTSFGISKNTYNELGPVWTDKHVWEPPQGDGTPACVVGLCYIPRATTQTNRNQGDQAMTDMVDITRQQYQEELLAAVHEGMIASVVIQINAILGAGVDRERLLAVCNTALQEPARILRP